MSTPIVDKELQDVMKDDRIVSTPDTDFGTQPSPGIKTRTTRASSVLTTEDTQTSTSLSGEAAPSADLVECAEDLSRDQVLSRHQVQENGIEEMDRHEGAEELPLSVYKEDAAALGQESQEEHVQKPGVSFQTEGASEVGEGMTRTPCTQPQKCQYKLPKLASDTPRGTDEVPSRSSSRRKVVSREVQRERDRVQMGALHSYNGLDVRYSTLVDHLDNVDNAYQGPVVQHAMPSKSTGFEVSPVDKKPVSTAGEMQEDGLHADT